MKENSGVMLGFISYLASGIMVFSSMAAGNNVIPSTTTAEGPLVVNIGAPHQASVLDGYMRSHGLEWPLQQQHIPALLVRALPKDMTEIDSSRERKSLFLRALLPIVLLENHYLEQDRQQLQSLLKQQNALNEEQRQWVDQLISYYRLEGQFEDPEIQRKLLSRLDTLPPSLVLAQGAIESGWGTSRFAQQGNSLFGQWSYKADTGLVPDSRIDGANHLVASFDSLQESVRSYMRNLNTHAAYRELRIMRENMRSAGHPLDPNIMAHGLVRYSARGNDYVEEIQAIIRINKLTQYDQIELTQVDLQSTAG